MPDDPNNPMLAANNADADAPYEGHDASAEAVFATPEQQAAAAAASDPNKRYRVDIPPQHLTAEEINAAAAQLANQWNETTKQQREALLTLRRAEKSYRSIHGTMSRLVAVCKEHALPMKQEMLEIVNDRLPTGERGSKPNKETKQ